MALMELEVIVHRDSETDGFWAEVVQLPGCFAAGHTREELEASLREAVHLYLDEADGSTAPTSDRIEAIERYHLSETHDLHRR
jgi:predicted RNase H-like HicB family nuclease